MPADAALGLAAAQTGIRPRRLSRSAGAALPAAHKILRNALKDDELRAGPGLGSRMAARFKTVGLIDPLPDLRGQAPQLAQLRK